MTPRRDDLLIALRGLLMGAADIVPGVSGGTVALIVGIYERLLAAISHLDARLIGHLRRGAWRAAAEHGDLRFLVALAAGIGLGVVGLAGVMHHLLEHHRVLTFAAFFGLILASGLLVGRMCRPGSAKDALAAIGIGVVAALAALWLVSRPQLAGQDGLLYTFGCGAVAICAMILPGISGSYLLVLLGKYEEVTGLIKGLPRGEVTADGLLTISVFAAGCAVGLLAFSRVLRWLLARAWTPTMAALCGFMIGSLWKIWPYQRAGETITDLKHQAVALRPFVPDVMDATAWASLGIAVGAAVFVLVADAAARRIKRAGD